MIDYGSRVLNEYEAVMANVSKLTSFLTDTDKVRSISGKQRELLFEQLIPMIEYAKILSRRLVDFGSFPP